MRNYIGQDVDLLTGYPVYTKYPGESKAFFICYAPYTDGEIITPSVASIVKRGLITAAGVLTVTTLTQVPETLDLKFLTGGGIAGEDYIVTLQFSTASSPTVLVPVIIKVRSTPSAL